MKSPVVKRMVDKGIRNKITLISRRGTKCIYGEVDAILVLY